VESGRLDLPSGGDVGTFLLSDGKLNGRRTTLKRLSLEELFTAYLDSLPIGALEPETLRVAGIHMGHFRRILGSTRKADSLTASRLQLYINKRARQPGKHGRKVSATTIKKELATLRVIWNWASRGENRCSVFRTDTSLA
jgi:site-specific recombinase XerD